MLHKTHTMKWAPAVLLAGFFILSCDTLAQKPATENLAPIRSQLLSKEGVQVIKDTAFSVATLTAVKNSSLSKQAAKNKCALKAKTQYLDFSTSRMDLSMLHAGLRPAFLTVAKRIWGRGRQLNLPAIETVCEEWVGLKCRVVLALPAHQLPQDIPEYKTVRDQVVNEALLHQHNVDPFLILELADSSQLPSALTYMAQTLKNTSGHPHIDQVVLGLPLDDLGAGWSGGKIIFPPEMVRNIPRSTLFKYLSVKPYDPVLLEELSQSFQRSGYTRCARLFKARADLMHASHTQVDGTPNAWLTPSWAPVIRANDAHSTSSTTGVVANLIIKYGGGLPVHSAETPRDPSYLAGKELFFQSWPDFESCLSLMQQSLDFQLTADACNYIGASYRNLGNFEAAIPFLIQAVNTNPTHEYAPVHLIHCLHQIGDITRRDTVLRLQRDQQSTDPWVVEQMKEFNQINK